MRVQPNPKKLITTVLVILATLSGLYPLLPVHATVTINSLNKTEGTVGLSVALNGTINNSAGNFSIFFDSVSVGGGKAVGTNAIASFVVPQATIGNHIVTLQDVGANINATQNFKVDTSYGVTPVLPTSPKQVQEGSSVQIKARVFGGNASVSYQKTVNITIPTGAQFTSLATFPTVNASGTAETVLNFPADFAPTGQHMNYTGTYTAKIYPNASAVNVPQSQFIVGMTDATTYHRLDVVNIRAMNYTKTNESANVTIAFGGKLVKQARVNATNGEIVYSWPVPFNASMGAYTVTVKTLTSPGTVKSPADVQNFTIPGFSVKFFTVNLNLDKVPNVNATVYQINPFDASKKVKTNTGLTDANGTKIFTPMERGNYSVNVFWRSPTSQDQVLVNRTNAIEINENRTSWTIVCNLTRISITVFDGKTTLRLPFVFFVVNSTYITISNTTKTLTQTGSTNTTATLTLNNQLVSATYTVSAFRAPKPFNTTSPFKIPAGTKLYSLNITCPAFSLTIHAEDARQASVGNGFPIKIYEYAGGLYDSATTGSDGNVTFTAASGQYLIRLYNPDQTIVLNETFYTLMNSSSLLVRSNILNANLSVHVVGYLGQPIPNVKVRIEPENETPSEKNTDGSGIAFFGSMVGGQTFVSVYVSGAKPSDTTQVNVEGNTVVTLSLGNYVSVFGLLVDTSQFAVLLTFIVFIIVFLLFIFYRQRRKPKTPAEPAEKT